MMHFETNKDMSVSLFLARIDRSRPQTLAGVVAQTAACLRHYVSDERLEKIKESGVPALVMTGTWDNLVNPKNSYHLSEKISCPLELYEGSGHGLPSEQSERYNKMLDHHFTKAIALRNK
jgi:pimeloyl-ACP methyl ester carboxylesterase